MEHNLGSVTPNEVLEQLAQRQQRVAFGGHGVQLAPVARPHSAEDQVRARRVLKGGAQLL